MSISAKFIATTVLVAIASLALTGCTNKSEQDKQPQYTVTSTEEVAFLNESGKLTRIERTMHFSELVDGLVPKGAGDTDKIESTDLYKSKDYSKSDRKVPFINGMSWSDDTEKAMTFSDSGSIAAHLTYEGKSYSVDGSVNWTYGFSYDEFVTFYNMQLADSSASEVNTEEIGNKISDRIWSEGKFPNAQIVVGKSTVKIDPTIAELNQQGVSASEAHDRLNNISQNDGEIRRNSNGLPPKSPVTNDGSSAADITGYQYSFSCATITPAVSNAEDIKAAIKSVQDAIGLPGSTIDIRLTQSLVADTVEPCALIPVYASPF